MFKSIKCNKYCPHTIIVHFDDIDIHRQDFWADAFSKYCQVIYKGVLSNEIKHVQSVINHVPSIKLLMDTSMKCIMQGKNKSKTSIKEHVRQITHEFRTRVVKGKIKIKYKISGILLKDNIVIPDDNRCVFVINNKFDIISQNKSATVRFGDHVNIYNNKKSGYDFLNSLFDTDSEDFKDIKNAIANTTSFINRVE